MEVRDGFIVGVFNYCDSWCARCALTSYCRLFADMAEMEASLDPNLKALAEAPPLPEEIPPPPPAWMQELIEEAEKNPLSAEEWAQLKPTTAAEHRPIRGRAIDYSRRFRHWLEARGDEAPEDESFEDIVWFHTLVPAKIARSLTTSPLDDAESPQSDANGSAKVALLGIDRSHAAWLGLVEKGVVSAEEAQPFIADLVWLGEALERVRPHARDFVRPALDEPDEMAAFLAAPHR
jgi:hypothetical protein